MLLASLILEVRVGLCSRHPPRRPRLIRPLIVRTLWLWNPVSCLLIVVAVPCRDWACTVESTILRSV